jgi:hypothetical protein
MKALHCTVRAVMGILTGTCLCQQSIASDAVAIVNINPSTNFTFDETHGDGMVGWSFQLLEPFTVTRVGWYAENPNGLSRPFQVGLWPGLPANGLSIPAGTNATRLGPWRVVDLAEPLLLQPGLYILGGLDTAATTDVIKYVAAGDPGYQRVLPPGSPVLIGLFFYGAMSLPGVPAEFGPPTEWYLWWGLELGPMLFGTNGPAISTRSGLSISPLALVPFLAPGPGPGGPPPPLLILTWPTGTLQQADEVTGPYVTVTNGASPYVIPTLSPEKFYRLGP